MNESHINRINELLGESVIYESAKKKTKIKLSLDDGSKKEMDFDGSLNDAKKKYSGKKVKTIRKSKSGDIIGEAVIISVEELNEGSKLVSEKGDFKIYFDADKQTYSVYKNDKLLIDGKHKYSEVKTYVNESTELDESTETEENKVFNLVLLKKLLNNPNKIGIDDWKSKDGVPGFVIYVSKYPSYHKMITKAIDKETLNDIEDELLKSIEGKIWKADDFRSFIKGDKDLNGKVTLVDFINDEDEPTVIFKNLETGKEFYSHKPMTSEKLKTYLIGKLAGKNMSESLEESEAEKVTFEKPLDIFKWIKDNNQYLYVKQIKDGKYEGSSSPKTKKGSILIDGMSANYAVQLYTKVNDDSRKILDKASLEKFLNIVTTRMSKKVNESVEDKFEIVTLDSLIKKSLKQYFETMLWSSTDSDGNNLDKDYSVSDISDALKEKSKKDLIAFAEYCEKNCKKELEEYLSEEDYGTFGHDFWLSRNGHGAGFFDRGTGYKELQKATKKFGEVDVYVTDDGEIDG